MADEKKSQVNYFKIFLIIVGSIAAAFVIFILVVVIALVIIKPFGINILKMPALLTGVADDAVSSYDHPMLSTEQEVLLESVGIDPATLPTEITTVQQDCAVNALGQTRVNEIIGGSAPTLTDMLKAQNCF